MIGRIKFQDGVIAAELGDDYNWTAPPDCPLGNSIAAYCNAMFHPLKNPENEGVPFRLGNGSIRAAARDLPGIAECDQMEVPLPEGFLA